MSDEKSNVSLASLTNDEVGNLLYEAVKNDDTTQFDSIISALTSEASSTTTDTPDASNWNQKGGKKLFGKFSSNKTKSKAKEKGKSKQHDLNYILNEETYGKSKSPLLIVAAGKNNFEIVQTLVSKYKVNVNATMKPNVTPLYLACQKNNYPMVSLLMKFGANPNIHETASNTTTMWAACYEGNLEIIKLLLNVSGEFEHTFNWNKLINQCHSFQGTSPFLILCQRGHVNCLDYLLSFEKEKLKLKQIEVKIDILIKAKDNGLNPLVAACTENQQEMMLYLVNNLYDNVCVHALGCLFLCTLLSLHENKVLCVVFNFCLCVVFFCLHYRKHWILIFQTKKDVQHYGTVVFMAIYLV